MTTYTYEIFLRHACVGQTEWQEFLLQVASFLDHFSTWQIYLQLEQNTIHYYLQTSRPLPLSFSLIDFLLKPSDTQLAKLPPAHRFYANKWSDNFVTVLQDFYRRQYRLSAAVITFSSYKSTFLSHIKIIVHRGQRTFGWRLLLTSPSTFLSIDFNKSKTFLFKKFPKYLKLEKVTELLTTTSTDALLEIDPFPYLDQTQYLTLDSFDFAKHSLVIGGSGSGKSRFLASFIHKVSEFNAKKYKVIVIDPHDAFYRDCAGISATKVTNFQTPAQSINLFSASATDINASVELMLTLFQSLMQETYNGYLERVLRYATFLLTTAQKFSFITLRRLLLDIEYRNQILTELQAQLPVSVAHFFLTDFNELKTQHYDSAIAPIIAFIDEMQMVPVFNSENLSTSLAETVQQNFLNIFSLSRLRLGDKVVKTIAGLLMQQLFLLAQQDLPEHLLIIIDEVAVVENPIIARFLSELRKYNASVILAGQYFDQITPQLRSAIFANTSNFYLFRTSQSDAEVLTRNLKIKIEGSDDVEDSQKLLTKLKARECLVQIDASGESLPIFKARTADYAPTTVEDVKPASNYARITTKKIDPKSNSCTIEQPFNYHQIIPDSPPHHPQNGSDSSFNTPEDSSKPSSSIPDPTTFPLPPPTFTFDTDDVDLAEFTNNYSTNRKPKESK